LKKNEEEGTKFKKHVAKKSANELLMDNEPANIPAIKKTIKEILKNGETTTQALKRIGKDITELKKKKQDTSALKQSFDMLTESAHTLLSNGYFNIYNLRREQIEGEAREETESVLEDRPSKKAKVEETPVGTSDYDELYGDSSSSTTASNLPAQSKSDGAKWEYKGSDGKTYGPYTSKDMLNWISNGYFVGDQAVLVRQIKEESIYDDEESEAKWLKSDSIDFSKYS